MCRDGNRHGRQRPDILSKARDRKTLIRNDLNRLHLLMNSIIVSEMTDNDVLTNDGSVH